MVSCEPVDTCLPMKMRMTNDMNACHKTTSMTASATVISRTETMVFCKSFSISSGARHDRQSHLVCFRGHGRR